MQRSDHLDGTPSMSAAASLTEVVDEMNYGIKVIALVVAVAAIILFIQRDDPSERLRVESGYIAQGKFAVIDSTASGYSLYFGSIDGKRSLRIASPHHLNDPFIDQNGRLFFVERVGAEKARFRLLVLEQEGRNTVCKVLLQSDKLIGAPVVPNGRLSDAVLFFSGPFNPKAVGTSVAYQEMEMLRAGKVSKILYQRYLAFGRLAQVSDLIFFNIAVTLDINVKETLVRIDAQNHLISEANPVSGVEFEGAPRSVSSDLSANLLYVSSRDYRAGLPKSYITTIDMVEGRAINVLKLPEGRVFSDPFPILDDNMTTQVLLLSVPSAGHDDFNSFTLSMLQAGSILDVRSIPLEPDDVFSTEGCVGVPVEY
jgi:hypothetical protein